MKNMIIVIIKAIQGTKHRKTPYGIYEISDLYCTECGGPIYEGETRYMTCTPGEWMCKKCMDPDDHDDRDDPDDPEDPDNYEEGIEEGIEIFAKTLAGKTLTLHIECDSRVESLRALIMDRMGIPTKKQRLIFKDQQHEDGYTISDYDIQDESELILLLTLRGGMPRKGNVIKSVVKSRTFDKTVSNDQVKFFRAFTKAEESTRLISVDFKNLLNGCTIDTLKRMLDYMKHDKTKSSTKVEKLCEMTSDIQEYPFILCDTIILRYNFAWPL